MTGCVAHAPSPPALSSKYHPVVDVDGARIDFGDGTPIVEGTSPTFVHTYGAAGPYTASMQAHGPLGDWSAPVTLVITVNDPPPPLIGIAASVPT